MKWTTALAHQRVNAFQALSPSEQTELLVLLNQRFPVSVFDEHLNRRRQAIRNLELNRCILDGAEQRYPQVIEASGQDVNPEALAGYGVVFTAGGDGERLRVSLEESGIAPEELTDFTKATYALPGFYRDFGTLHINLAVMADLCRRTKLDIPVIITTGPEGSVTARVIPDILRKYSNFGLKTVLVVMQDERLHFTMEEKIAIHPFNGRMEPVTHPDETGGPVMKLRAPLEAGKGSAIDLLRKNGCRKLILLQGTAVYESQVILKIAAVAKNFDGIGVGIARPEFLSTDPFGTYVELVQGGRSRLCILEKDVRNETTLHLRHRESGAYLPYNTGFYAFDLEILEKHALPDYATPPKQVLPGLAPSPKIGYAGTDILPLASRPAILSIAPEVYANLKSHIDLPVLAEKARSFGLGPVCSAF